MTLLSFADEPAALAVAVLLAALWSLTAGFMLYGGVGALGMLIVVLLLWYGGNRGAMKRGNEEGGLASEKIHASGFCVNHAKVKQVE
ncbi:hypothetical protein ACFOQM_16380 [Paenibacillus sp. GCM10012307]|uniref:Uncharacterized protein n=1 Tax=Paenibacillus roseus TaxID=2798579 RepID=A0A934J0Z2_9BACL|nr:hypothetical protein [Paenibacillus roseus]MBJ6362821.1 hypothetical protein [Paenibacillus roseus]